MHTPGIFLACLLAVLLLLTPTITFATTTKAPIQPTTDTLTITLNCTQTNGLIRPYSQINDGPLPIKPSSADLTTQYQTIGITSIRTHDNFGPTDISTIFPNLTLDTTDPANYHFNTSDHVIAAIINTGAQVYYRLGESASSNTTLRQPPTNITAWADVCLHITRHYNNGWANGHYYNIRYWKLWNEPDINAFWDANASLYYHLYQTTATALKTSNQSLKVGGPCTSNAYNPNYTTTFLQYCQNHSLPLDFFSWHSYASHPADYYNASLHIRNLLDTYGHTNSENINSEWNYNILSPQRDKDNAKNTAFTAATLTAFQDARLDQAYRYRGTQDKNWLMRLVGFDLSLFDQDGIYKRPALAYQALHTMTTQTPNRLVTPPQDASTGITYLAGIADDQTNISILLSNFNAKDTAYTLTLTDIPWNQTYTVTQYLIDETHHLQITNRTTQNTDSLTINSSLRSNSVHFYYLSTSSAAPSEGPNVARIPILLRLKILDPLTFILGIWLFLTILG
jgi:hypothetical protein